MPQTLFEYAEWLERRSDLIWPKPPPVEKPKAKPYTLPLQNIKAVTWSIYGTLLHISGGRLLHIHAQELAMQVALEKTIEEFHMWPAMSRKPGQPWEVLLVQYKRLVEEAQMVDTGRVGDMPHVDSAAIWRKLIERLLENGYQFDESFYGDLDDFAAKVAYFFHAALQGVSAMPQALATLKWVAQSGRRQALLGDSQCFTLVQLLRALRGQGTLPPLDNLLDLRCSVFSHELGVRQPSPTLYETCVRRFAEVGIQPHEILHVGSRLRGDLAAAKKAGLRTALFAGDKESLDATAQEIRHPSLRPDRLLTELSQIEHVLKETE